MFAKLNGYKTYIVAAGTIIYALVQGWAGNMDAQTEVLTILAALGAGGIRHGISTSAAA